MRPQSRTCRVHRAKSVGASSSALQTLPAPVTLILTVRALITGKKTHPRPMLVPFYVLRKSADLAQPGVSLLAVNAISSMVTRRRANNQHLFGAVKPPGVLKKKRSLTFNMMQCFMVFHLLSCALQKT